MRRTLLLFAAAGLLVAADAPDDAAKKERDKMQGEWVMASGERDGQKIPDEQAKTIRRTTKGDQFTITVDGQVVAKGTFKVDPTKKPKTIDFLREGDEKILGIYELDGDTYKACYSAPGKERPTEFSAKAGGGNTLSVWKREKK